MIHPNASLAAASVLSPGQAALIAIILVTIVAMSIVSRRRREMTASPRAAARREIDRIREDRAIHSDVGELMLQLQQVAREISAQLDNKFQRMERVIADADRRIRVLQRSGDIGADQAVLDITVGNAPDASSSDEGSSFQRTAHHERILALSAEGRTPMEIASELGRSIEEIELVIAVDERRRTLADMSTSGNVSANRPNKIPERVVSRADDA